MLATKTGCGGKVTNRGATTEGADRPVTISGLAQYFRRLVSAMRQARRDRHTAAAIAQLSDHLLRDAGCLGRIRAEQFMRS